MRKINSYAILILVSVLLPVIALSQSSTPHLLYNNGDVLYIQSGAVLHIQGDVINASGSGSSFTNNGLLNLEGDFTNNGTFTTDASVGEGAVRLIGNNTMAGSAFTGRQTLSGTLSTPGTGSFYNLVIDGGASGQITALGSNITVTGSLVWNGSSTMANTYNPSGFPSTLGNSSIMLVRGSVPPGAGIIQTSAQQVYISSSASTAIAGYGSSSYINGFLKRTVAASASYDLPVGSNSNYELANITFNSAMTGTSMLSANFNTGATTAPSPGTCIINGSKINGLLNAGYWTIHPDIQPTAGTYTAMLHMMGYTNSPASNGAVTPGEQIGIVKRTNSSSPWLGCGVTVYGNPATDQGYGSCIDDGSFTNGVASVSRSLVSYFSDFGIGMEQSNIYALPVELISLSAEPIDNSFIRLNWATASEQDNKGFQVMRSTDGVNFSYMGWVNGSGTTSTQHDYSYDDKTVDPNIIYYYKLNQVNSDGNGTETNIVSASITGGTNVTVSELMPNPTSGKTRLVISTTAESQKVSVMFYDILGKLIISSDNNLVTKDTNTLNFDMSSFLDGSYTAIIRVGDKIYSKKVILVK